MAPRAELNLMKRHDEPLLVSSDANNSNKKERNFRKEDPSITTTNTSSKGNDSRLKFWLLVLLVVQGSSAVLTGRYTRSSVSEDELYEISHLVFVIECVKFVASVMAEYISTKGKFLQSVDQHIFKNPIDSCKVLVPAVLYVIQNSLTYIALSNLTAPVFISLQQGKLLATALVSVSMLNRTYSTKQWVCLFVLAIGVAIVALDERGESLDLVDSEDSEAMIATQEAAATSEPQQFFIVGLLAVTGGCFSSAFAGVYFEKVLAPEKASRANDSDKKVVQGDEECQSTANTNNNNKLSSQPSLWIRNMQLAFFSIIFSYLQGRYDTSLAISASKMDFSDEGEGPIENSTDQKDYLHGFTPYVWLLVGLQAGGGLLVAAVMKYSDNVMKGLAMGIGVVVASVLSTLLFDVHLSGQFIVGACIIFASVYAFSNPIPILPTKTTESS